MAVAYWSFLSLKGFYGRVPRFRTYVVDMARPFFALQAEVKTSSQVAYQGRTRQSQPQLQGNSTVVADGLVLVSTRIPAHRQKHLFQGIEI
ncbi:hypothetical protein HZ326_23471 [Fusarium oxysporum f. sp. albedinis]|nr:hypothetical protein HZ326_23471 [Fusarium oxysporum f. sp. albedinis]